MFPLFLKLESRLCVVVGGGPVGRRKAAALLEGGARVRLVCLQPRPPGERSPDLEWLEEPYRVEHLAEAALVFAAAAPAVNRRVVADARGRGVWVNVADEPAEGDFYMPAVVRRGPLCVAVSTGGAAPALAQEIRSRLEAQFDDAFGCWLDVLATLRPLVLARVADPEQRREVFGRLCGWEWLERLRHEGVEKVREDMAAFIQRPERGA
jgi:precorrin-2 dehydrogenase/sirohydrochlorin ferrochelatase